MVCTLRAVAMTLHPRERSSSARWEPIEVGSEQPVMRATRRDSVKEDMVRVELSDRRDIDPKWPMPGRAAVKHLSARLLVDQLSVLCLISVAAVDMCGEIRPP